VLLDQQGSWLLLLLLLLLVLLLMLFLLLLLSGRSWGERHEEL